MLRSAQTSSSYLLLVLIPFPVPLSVPLTLIKGFLTILWIAEAGVTTNGVSGDFSVDCDNAIKLSEQLNTKNPDLGACIVVRGYCRLMPLGPDIIISICQKARAAQGLSFVVWILCEQYRLDFFVLLQSDLMRHLSDDIWMRYYRPLCHWENQLASRTTNRKQS